ncbi:hypothetical protein O1611_g3489 [Lasiodiplodia mahajangana]|uniref:Uncharacterized protein n=1 Tax=Lasiodiplodia mahajangana TaxID=1108764 RepID=A0ACC2JRS6_9PEZI|nr:hypothetical protein O1611_g3489 [Lasiodiplodia mahajangana]
MAAATKSSVEEAPKDADKIIVTLSLRGSHSIPKRRLVLTHTCPVIPIGRSSKVHSKGFVPAEDNAWFENPVMSREHAQLIAKFDEKPTAVYIKDVSSFHGTFRSASNGQNNEQRLTPDELVKLTNGDLIRFGIDIFRAEKSYPPCSVEFSVEEMAPAASPTVLEPDNAMPLIGSRPSPIDLTADGDDVTSTIAKLSSQSTTNGKTISDVIDLTSEPNCDSDVEVRTVNVVEPRPAGFDASSAPFPSDGRTSPLAPMGLIQTSDGRIIMPSSLTLPSDDEGVCVYADAWSDEDAQSVLSDSSQPESIHSLGATEELISPLADTSSEVGGEHESSNFEEEFYSSDGISNFDQDSNSEDGDRSLFLSEEEDDEDEDEDEDDDMTRELSDDQNETATLFPFPTAVHEQTHSKTSTGLVTQLGEKSGKFEFFAAREKNRAALHQNHSTVPISALRETLLVVPYDNSNDAGPTAMSESSRSASPSLSYVPETTALPKEVHDEVSQVSSEFPETAEVPEAPEAPDASSIKLADTDTNQYSVWTVSGDQFINNPPTDEPPASQVLRSQPADFDMTSAYKFQQSKLATVNETVSKTRRLHIQDLLAQEPKQCVNASEPAPKLPTLVDPPASCASTPAKRSYEEAFNQTEEDTTTECAGRVAPCLSSIDEAKRQNQNPQERVNTPATQSNTIAQGTQSIKEQDKLTQEPTVIFVQPEAHRPAKRMRLATVAAQVVACVALGGAATFSYLVNTAPVF